MARASRGPKQEISWSPSRLDRRRRKSRIEHHVLSGSTIELLPPYRWRGEIVVVELAERGAYRGYGTLPAKSRRSPRAGPRSSMCSRPETSYRRIIYAHQGGGGVRGPFKAGANEVEGGGGSSMEPERGSRWGPRSPPGAGVLIQARGSQRGKYCSSKPRRGHWLGPQSPSAVGASLQTQGSQKVSIIRRDRGGVSG